MDENAVPLTTEEYISKMPALHLLQNLGFRYLPPADALALRDDRTGNVILEDVLTEWLRGYNVIRYRGEEHPFSEPNIIEAVQALTDMMYDGLVRTNEKVYDLLTFGKALQQSIRGDVKSFTLQYVDWKHPENNVYHVTEEFQVARTGHNGELAPDIVLFVNGIPFGIIECKRTDTPSENDPLEAGITQTIRNQKDDGIPRLFVYAQLVMALNKNEAKYATVGTAKRFWAMWKESRPDEDALHALVNTLLPPDAMDRMFAARRAEDRACYEARMAEGCEITEQDRALFALCRRERLLDLAYRFIVFDAGVKKIARYQQYFCVLEAIRRITGDRNPDGSRRGGYVWHTQGSGKSLTMIMLARCIALDPTIQDYKIIIVTDRDDLDEQIHGTFQHCGYEPVRARSGKQLAKLLSSPKAAVVTTIVNKFDKAVSTLAQPVDDPNIIVLVDESHRTQYGALHAKMKQALPRACYIGFTGTPVMKRDKNIMARFGGLIDVYNIQQAVMDKAVVPLLYEGRHVNQYVDGPIDRRFDMVTDGLSEEQVADLKRKFATTDQLNKADQKVEAIAHDISRHFRDNWQDTGFKAQLVAPDKATALLYKEKLDELGMVTSEVLISPPDDREGDEDIYLPNTNRVNIFWTAMMAKYGGEKEYTWQVINAFKNADEPEIIIVVDKLLTGFDAPRNTVLYLTRRLKEHTLLQAIARVNRLHEGKEFGYILDYRGVLEDLDDALNLYAALPEFEQGDLGAFAATLTDISGQIALLPQRHSDLWHVFKEVGNKYDEEAYERLLAAEDLRASFYDRLSSYGRTLAIALSSAQFLHETPGDKVDRYKRDLKFFENLRRSVERRYAEKVDFKALEPRIQKLIDTHVTTGEIEEITPLVNIFDEQDFQAEVERIRGGDAAKADTIAHRTLKSIEERWQMDPTFYKRFSDMLKDAIDAFRQERIKAAEYLSRVTEIMHAVAHRTGEALPEVIRDRDVARAYYGVLLETLEPLCEGERDSSQLAADAAVAIEDIVDGHRIVQWTTNTDVQNRMRQDIEDYLFEAKGEWDIKLTWEEMDEITERCIDIAIVRVP